MQQNGWIQYGISALVIMMVLVLRFRSMSKVRKFNPARAWIVPAILSVLAVVTLAANPPTPLALAASGAALPVGSLLGWQRGRLIHLYRDPSTGDLMQKASPAAMLLLVGVILLRMVVRSEMGPTVDSSGHLSGNALVLTDALLFFAIGLVAATRIEMAIRAKRIAAGEERADPLPAPSPSAE